MLGGWGVSAVSSNVLIMAGHGLLCGCVCSMQIRGQGLLEVGRTKYYGPLPQLIGGTQ
jgi:hypothetical protein